MPRVPNVQKISYHDMLGYTDSEYSGTLMGSTLDNEPPLRSLDTHKAEQAQIGFLIDLSNLRLGN